MYVSVVEDVDDMCKHFLEAQSIEIEDIPCSDVCKANISIDSLTNFCNTIGIEYITVDLTDEDEEIGWDEVLEIARKLKEEG